MKKTLRPVGAIMLALSLICGAQSAWALKVTDLPVKEINGKRFYCYEVKAKETLYSLSKKLGISQDEIISFNPDVYAGVKANSTLFFPAAVFDKAPAKSKDKEASKKSADVANADATNKTKDSKKGKDSAKASTKVTSITHNVEKGETIYGISRRYGITTDQLMDANPDIRSGLKTGMVLTVPVAGSSALASDTAKDKKGADKSAQQTASASSDKATAQSQQNSKKQTVEIAVMLPFNLSTEKRGRDAQMYLEFYKGFLLAVDAMRDSGVPLHVTTVDAGTTDEEFSKAMSNPALKNAQVIIAPDDRMHRLSQLANWGLANNVSVLNMFAVHDDNYLKNARMIQGNVPADVMVDKALDGFVSAYRNRLVIFPKATDATNEKTSFQDKLMARLRKEGISFKEVSFSGTMDASKLQEAIDPTQEVVFVPTQMSQRDLNKLLSSINDFQKSHVADVTIFGYPEWITYRGETKDALHELGATYYSRFIDDPQSPYSQDIHTAFKKWYGNDISESVPRPGVMGFDTGMFLLRTLKAQKGVITENASSYKGVQNGFNLKRAANGGLYNDRIFFIDMRPSGAIDAQGI